MNMTIGSSNGLDAVEESFLVKLFEILQNVPIISISRLAIGVAMSLLVGRCTVEQTVDKVAGIRGTRSKSNIQNLCRELEGG